MLFNNTPEKFWNLLAGKYAASPINDRVAYEKKLEKIKTLLSPETTVLDIGCGTGTQCCDMAESAKHITGLDFSSILITIANQRLNERRLNNVSFINASIENTSFDAGSFDVVSAFYVLHFLRDIDSTFSHIHKLLRPNGLFIHETPCLGDKNKRMGKSLQVAGSLGIIPRINLFTAEQIEWSVEQAGFKIKEKIFFGQPDGEFTLLTNKI